MKTLRTVLVGLAVCLGLLVAFSIGRDRLANPRPTTGGPIPTHENRAVADSVSEPHVGETQATPVVPSMEQLHGSDESRLKALLSCRAYSEEFWDAATRFLNGSQLTLAAAMDLFERARASGDEDRMVNVLLLIRLGASTETDHQIGISAAQEAILPMAVRCLAVQMTLRQLPYDARGLAHGVRRGAPWGELDPVTPAVRAFVRSLLSNHGTPTGLVWAVATGLSAFIEGQEDLDWTRAYMATLVNDPGRLDATVGGLATLDVDARGRMLAKVPELVSCLVVTLSQARGAAFVFLDDKSLAFVVSEECRNSLLLELSRDLDQALQSSRLRPTREVLGTWMENKDGARGEIPSDWQTGLVSQEGTSVLYTYLLYLRYSKDDHLQLDSLYRAARFPAVDVQTAIAQELGDFRQPWAVDVLRALYQSVDPSSSVARWVKASTRTMTENGVTGAAEFSVSIR